MRDGKIIHFTEKGARFFLFHSMNKLKNADFSSKKGLNVNFRVTRDTPRMSISLRKEQGFYFMPQISSKTLISARKKVCTCMLISG